MSRVGKKPIPVPGGVTVSIQDREVRVQGPKGELSWTHRPEIQVALDEENKQVVCTCDSDQRQDRALFGLTRSLIANMIHGVTQGYEKRLEIHGVGYVGTVQNNLLQLRVGFANEIEKKIPPELTVTCPDQTHVVVQGVDKQRVGQFAAEVRAVRKPEPYKGKGIRYEGEQIRRKAGKAAT